MIWELAATLAADLLAFTVLFESTAVLLYLLIGRGSYGSWSAAYHIVIYTMAASLVLVAGLMSESATVTELGVVLLFAVKVPLLVLHLWLPSAHASAPLAGSIMLSGVILKLGGLLGLRRDGPTRDSLVTAAVLVLNRSPAGTTRSASTCLPAFSRSTPCCCTRRRRLGAVRLGGGSLRRRPLLAAGPEALRPHLGAEMRLVQLVSGNARLA